MGTTTNFGLPYPESSDFVADGATAIENLADAIDVGLQPVGMWIPAAQFSAALITSATFGVFGSWSNVAQAWSLPDGGNELIVTSFRPPRTGTIQFRAYYQGGGSGNFRIAIASGGGRTPGTPGDTMYTLTGYYNPLVTPSYNGLAYAGFPSMSVDLDDLVNISFGREGGHATDTSANACDFFGVYVLYV